MLDRRLRHRSVHTLRRSFVAVAVLAYVAAAVGVPLPTGGGKDRSVPFPCMDRPCGCRDAAGCKEHCCCFTSEQKLAWAAEHQVDPEPFVNFSALASRRQAGEVMSSENGVTCCAISAHQPEASARCHEEFASHSGSVGCGIESQRSDVSDDSLASRPALPDGDDDSISIAAYRACHGLAPLWSTLSAALPPPRPMAYEFVWDLGESVAPVSIEAVALSLSPPTPPPRG